VCDGGQQQLHTGSREEKSSQPHFDRAGPNRLGMLVLSNNIYLSRRRHIVYEGVTPVRPTDIAV
jgi:hypothetical protein